MKNLRKFVLLGISMMFMASCVNDNLSEPWDSEVNKVLASVSDQVKAVESSIEVVEALQEALKAEGVEISEAAELLGQHVDALSAGMSLSEGSLATLEVQKRLASILGIAQAELYFADALDQDIQKSFTSVEKAVKTWLGELFVENYSAAVTQAKVEAIAEELSQEIKNQELSVDALVSDVETGLRKDADPKALAALSESLAGRSSDLESFRAGVASTATQINKEYSAAIRTAVSDPAAIKTAEIKTLNEAAQTQQ